MRTPARILIVDDNPTNVKVLATRLTAEGYEIVTAADGEEGLAAARAHTPDLILLDVMMPKLDGFEVCRRLRADASFPFTPIIMVTAMADSRDVVAGLEAGQKIPKHPEGAGVYHFLEGTGWMLVGEERFPVQAGATVLAPAGTARGMEATTRLAFIATRIV